MSKKKKGIFFQGMIARNADIDLVVAEVVGERADMKAQIKAMRSDQQALQRQMEREHRKVTDMQTVLDKHMLEYERKASEEG